MGVHGPVESVNINNRRFPVDGEADVAIALSGYTNEVKPNGAPGETRLVKSRKPGRATGIPIEIDDDRGDQEFIQEAQDSKSPIPFSITYVSGVVYSGEGGIVEDPERSTKEGTMEISYMGSLGKQ